MKNYTKSLTIICLALGLTITGCQTKKIETSPFDKTVSAFNKRFPNAEQVKWHKKRGYDYVTFIFGHHSKAEAAAGELNSAWFVEGSETCTYVELEITLAQLKTQAPKVAQAWANSVYISQNYVLEDIDVLTQTDKEPVYKLEIENGEQEIELFFTAQGVLLRERVDVDTDDENDENEPCPQEIYDFIDAKFPSAIVVDFDIEEQGADLFYEVEINIEKVNKELLFDKNNKFLYATVEIDEQTLPEAVRAAFMVLAADPETWDEVAKLENEKQEVVAYLLTVEDEASDTETTYKVDPNGKTIK
ncbi:MAG: PepSY-like domain-containing protein [Mucinivorans sp.]